MKSRPIIFNSEMVRAILEGRKTQTRRVIKPQPYMETGPDGEPGPLHWDGIKRPGGFSGLPEWLADDFCPHGQPGDRLWVKETWSLVSKIPLVCLHRANLASKTIQPKWRPSTQMPRWASRITLEITDVRVERVQDISEEDSKAEGLKFCRASSGTDIWYFGDDSVWSGCGNSPENAFSVMWDSIYQKRNLGWHTNPWVWVIKFKNVS